MHENPLISIITVCFNAEHHIEATLLSLKQQSFKNFEHIVIDGASTDSTLEIIKKQAPEQTFVVSEPDKGLYDAMNKGLKLAKGKYVLFLNAGDSFHNAATLQKYADSAKENPDIIYGDTIIVDFNRKEIGRRHLSVPEKLDKGSFSNGMLICHQAFMVKKELTSPYDLSYRFSSDYDWCVKCINRSSSEKCINLKQVTIDYLSDGLSDNHKKDSLKERFLIMTKHYGWPKTVYNHIKFIFRALKRGKI